MNLPELLKTSNRLSISDDGNLFNFFSLLFHLDVARLFILIYVSMNVSTSKTDNLIQAEDHGTSSNEENKRTIHCKKIKEKHKPVLHEDGEIESQNNNDIDRFNEKTDIPTFSKLGELPLTLAFFPSCYMEDFMY